MDFSFVYLPICKRVHKHIVYLCTYIHKAKKKKGKLFEQARENNSINLWLRKIKAAHEQEEYIKRNGNMSSSSSGSRNNINTKITKTTTSTNLKPY